MIGAGGDGGSEGRSEGRLKKERLELIKTKRRMGRGGWRLGFDDGG